MTSPWETDNAVSLSEHSTAKTTTPKLPCCELGGYSAQVLINKVCHNKLKALANSRLIISQNPNVVLYLATDEALRLVSLLQLLKESNKTTQTAQITKKILKNSDNYTFPRTQMFSPPGSWQSSVSDKLTAVIQGFNKKTTPARVKITNIQYKVPKVQMMFSIWQLMKLCNSWAYCSNSRMSTKLDWSEYKISLRNPSIWLWSFPAINCYSSSNCWSPVT